MKSPSTVLVVDDHPPNLALLTHLLEIHGYDVMAANGAQEAMAAIAQKLPRLILMDLQMPGIDGFALTRMLKASPPTAGVPIVAVTSFAMSGDKERALAAGCDDYVAKPIDTRTLPLLVARYVNGTPPSTTG
ncbi:MAG: response regulator [Rubrivivax sp.]|nr:response regulator [Rubrivivax sp.]